MASGNLEAVVTLIEKELSRLTRGSKAFVTSVAIDGEAPEGWVNVRISGRIYSGRAHAFVEVLQGVRRGVTAACDALDLGWYGQRFECHDERETEETVDGWRDAHEFAGLDIEDTGFGLVVFRANDGLRYGFAPSDPDFLLSNSTHDFSERFGRAEEAIGAARTFAAAEANRA